jgi:hypothetical protein
VVVDTVVVDMLYVGALVAVVVLAASILTFG